jgi:hypothetical protein
LETQIDQLGIAESHLEAVACSFSKMGSLRLVFEVWHHPPPATGVPLLPQPMAPHEGHVLEGVEWGKIRAGASIKLKERQNAKTLTAPKG